MRHLKNVSRVPEKAIEWPESHDILFILENLPQSVLDIVMLVVTHVKALTEEA